MRLFPLARCDRCGLPGNHPDCPHPVGVFNEPRVERPKWYRLKTGEPVFVGGFCYRYNNVTAIEGEPVSWITVCLVRYDGTEEEIPETWLVPKLELNDKGNPKVIRRPTGWTQDPWGYWHEDGHHTGYPGPKKPWPGR